MLTLLVSSNGNLSRMLKAALGEDFYRVELPDPLPGSSKKNETERRGPMRESVVVGGRRAIISSAMGREMK